jgi:hypothetical protein
MDFVDQYSCAGEEIDPKFPQPLGEEIGINIYFYNHHAHD